MADGQHENIMPMPTLSTGEGIKYEPLKYFSGTADSGSVKQLKLTPFTFLKQLIFSTL